MALILLLQYISLSVGFTCLWEKEVSRFLENLGFPLKADFLALCIACPDAIDIISRTTSMAEILTTLNGFSIDFRPTIPPYLYLLLGRITFLG